MDNSGRNGELFCQALPLQTTSVVNSTIQELLEVTQILILPR